MFDEDGAREVAIFIREGVEKANIWLALPDGAANDPVDARVLVGEIRAVAAIPDDVDARVFVIIVVARLRENIRCVLRIECER